MENRTKNSVRNIIWGFLQKIVAIIGPFAVRTVLIYKLGAEYSGLNSLFTSILSILSLTELGFSNAIVYSMYKPVAERDTKTINAFLNIYKKIYRLIGLIIFLLGLALLPLLRYLISKDMPQDVNLYVLYLVFLINTTLSYLLFAYKTSVLSAYQREDLISKNIILVNICTYALQILSVLFFSNYYYYVLILPISTVVLNFANKRVADKNFPEIHCEGFISQVEKEELKKRVVGLTIWKVGAATRNTFDSVVISMYYGLTTVAIYNNYFYIINGINTIFAVISTSITAGVGNKIASASSEENYRDLEKFHFIYMWISGMATVLLLCDFQPFMHIWMGEKLMFSNFTMVLFCYYFWMMKQGDMNSVYYQAAGLWWQGKWRSIVEAAINISLNLLLGFFWGVNGIIVATIVAYTAIYFYGPKFVYIYYFRNGKLKDFYLSNLKSFLIVFLAGGASYFICYQINYFLNSAFFSILMNSIVCILLYNTIFIIIYSKSDIYSVSKKWIFDKIQKRYK